MNYEDFLCHKAITSPTCGLSFEPELRSHLFPFQADIVRWSLKRGRSAIFADCGLGKGIMYLEWARIIAATQGPVLILAPLAVAQQTVRECEKFYTDMSVHYCRQMPASLPAITITNKRSYWEQACENLRQAKRVMGDLFDVA